MAHELVPYKSFKELNQKSAFFKSTKEKSLKYCNWHLWEIWMILVKA